jgi:hypothetical protein
VEIRDGLVQAPAAESGGEFLELAEGAGRLIGLLVGFEFIITAGPLDERIDAPDIAGGIGGVGFAVERRDAGERAAAGFTVASA